MDELPECCWEFSEEKTVKRAQDAWVVGVDTDKEANARSDEEVDYEKECDDLHRYYTNIIKKAELSWEFSQKAHFSTNQAQNLNFPFSSVCQVNKANNK